MTSGGKFLRRLSFTAMELIENQTENFADGVPVSPRRRLLIGFAVWTLLAVLTAGRNHLTYARLGYAVPVSTTLLSSFTDFYLWAAASILIFYLCEKFPVEQPRILRNLSLFAILSVVFTLTLAIVSVPIFVFLSEGSLGNIGNIFESIVFSPWNLYQGFITFWVIVVVGHALQYNRRAREKDNRLRNLAVQLAEAKLSALKMQLQPHFLFNTLNSIHALLHRDADKAEQMIAYLGDFLRMTLNSSRDNETALADELSFLETYLKIEKIRFQDKLRVAYDIAPDALRARVPTLILQPIVENAVRHGFADKSDNCLLEIAARIENNRLHLRVSDNGAGFGKRPNGNGAGGFGLRNTELRLTETYAANYSFSAQNKSGENGAFVEMEIPLTNTAIEN